MPIRGSTALDMTISSRSMLTHKPAPSPAIAEKPTAFSVDDWRLHSHEIGIKGSAWKEQKEPVDNSNDAINCLAGRWAIGGGK